MREHQNHPSKILMSIQTHHQKVSGVYLELSATTTNNKKESALFFLGRSLNLKYLILLKFYFPNEKLRDIVTTKY